jgi:hypothetical protein
MAECNTVSTPMDAKQKILRADEDYQAPRELQECYARAIGSLLYLMLCTRPDIAYALTVFSRFTKNPTPAHKQ